MAMNDSMAGLLAFACAAAVGALGTKFLFLGGKSKEQKLRERAIKAGCVAKGGFVGSELESAPADYLDGRSISADRRAWMHITYEYFVDGRRYLAATKYPINSPELKNLPLDVEVYYDRCDPSKYVVSTVDIAGQQKKSGCYLTILLVVVSFGVALNVFRSLG